MEVYFLFVVKVIFVENFVFLFFLGMCIFIVVFKKILIVIGFGIFVMIV